MVSSTLFQRNLRRLKEVNGGRGTGGARILEAGFRALIEQSSLGIHIFTPDGHSLFVNDAWNEFWNVVKKEPPKVTNIFEDEQLRATGLLSFVEEGVGGAVVTTPPLFYDPTRTGREGNSRWLRGFVQPVKDEAGCVLEVALIVEDVTEELDEEMRLRLTSMVEASGDAIMHSNLDVIAGGNSGVKKPYGYSADEATRRSKASFRAVFDRDAIGMALVDVEGRIVESDLALQEMLGYGGEELRGMHFADVTHPDDVATDLELFKELMAGKLDRFQLEKRYIRKDGSLVWGYLTSSSIRSSEDNPQFTVGMVENITNRKQAEEALKESEERYRAVVEQSAESIWLFDPDSKQVLESNSAFQEMLGYSAEELQNMANYDFVVHSREDVDATVWRKVQEGISASSLERKYRRKDGTLVDVEVGGTIISYRGKEVVCSVARDLTERKRAEEALKESEERFRSVFENAPVGVALVGLHMRYLKVNRALCEMIGYSEEEMLQKTAPEIIHPEDQEISSERVRQTLEEELGSFTLERRYIHADGHVVWNLTSVSLIRDSRGDPSHFVCLHQDITERKELEERLEHQAFHDSLTGLPNRRLFMDRLEQAIARLGRRKEPIAMLYLDLDNFKVINDSLGHEVGDQLLVEVAVRLKECTRPEDTMARFGGDEFVVLLERISKNLGGASRVAERIIEALAAPFHFEGREVFVGASIGIVPASEAPEKPGDLLRNADLALYRAKKKGKGRYEFFDESMGNEALKRLELENALRKALEREEFRVYYQPEISVATNKIVSMEALVRWEHPERGLLKPHEFLPAAEESGLIVQIGEWVFDEVCRQGREWQKRFADWQPLRVCTNISARQFLQSDLVGRVAESLQNSGLRAQGLSLEVPEGVLMDDAKANVEKLTRLKDLGIHIVIDEFGTAYTSLYYLKSFPLNFLKIDRSLIARLGEEPEDKAIVSAMINLAKALGWAVAAQGVETEEQLALLREMECDIVQGYYFSRPVTSEEATTLLGSGLEPASS